MPNLAAEEPKGGEQKKLEKRKIKKRNGESVNVISYCGMVSQC